MNGPTDHAGARDHANMSPGATPPGAPPYMAQPPIGPRSKGTSGLVIGAVVAGGFLVLASIPAAIAIPTFLNYLKRTKSTEAIMNIRKMFDHSVTYFNANGAFPSSTGPTPPSVNEFRSMTAGWETDPTWSALSFAIHEPHYFQYQYNSSGVGARAHFTASAFGDLDGDGIQSTFLRFGLIEGGQVTGSGGIYIANELE